MATTKKIHPADAAALALIPACKKFTATILKNNKPQTAEFDTLGGARIEAARLNATANNGRKALVYAITGEGRAILVPASYGEPNPAKAADAPAKATTKPAKADNRKAKPAKAAKLRPRRPRRSRKASRRSRSSSPCYRGGGRMAFDQYQGDLRPQEHEAQAGRRRHALRFGPEVKEKAPANRRGLIASHHRNKQN